MPKRGLFHHEAMFYAGETEFVEHTVPFVREGLDAGEAVLVAVSPRKTDLLREGLDGDAAAVGFTDMGELGRNPARIIPRWREFLEENTLRGVRSRGIGEPVWAGRTDDELVECEHHESLLNLAFAGAPAWRLMCPYDSSTLSEDVLARAHGTHPHVAEGGSSRRSDAFAPPGPGPLSDDLPEPAVAPDVLEVPPQGTRQARAFVSGRASEAGLSEVRVGDLTLAVSELVANSLRHASGEVRVLAWRDGAAMVCEVQDSGRIFDPLVGRQRPSLTQARGRGLWIVNQVCDLVQIRSSEVGSRVRVRMALEPA